MEPCPAPISDGVPYDRYVGVVCPDCGSPDTVVRRTLPWDYATTPPVRIRYHACRQCDRRFKSVES